MNYELAKQLKEVGFPQGGIKEKYCTECNRWACVECIAHKGDILKNPTLEELIEACGDNVAFEKYNGKVYVAGEYINHDGEIEPRIEGESVLEAVAKLWLLLNKK